MTSFSNYKKIVQNMKLKRDSVSNIMRELILNKEILHKLTTSEEIQQKFYEVTGKKLPITNISPFMQIFLAKRAVRKKKIAGKVLWFGAWVKPSQIDVAKAALPFLKLMKVYKKEFKKEFQDLQYVFGNSGTCTAFLFRKILEKAVFLALVRNKVDERDLREPSSGKYFGLGALLNVAAVTKVRGVPILLPRTIKMIQGIKFLGDVAAHNYLINVDMEDITPQLPFITTALKELARFF
jgi:hypothetical protein